MHSAIWRTVKKGGAEICKKSYLLSQIPRKKTVKRALMSDVVDGNTRQ